MPPTYAAAAAFLLLLSHGLEASARKVPTNQRPTGRPTERASFGRKDPPLTATATTATKGHTACGGRQDVGFYKRNSTCTSLFPARWWHRVRVVASWGWGRARARVQAVSPPIRGKRARRPDPSIRRVSGDGMPDLISDRESAPSLRSSASIISSRQRASAHRHPQGTPASKEKKPSPAWRRIQVGGGSVGGCSAEASFRGADGDMTGQDRTCFARGSSSCCSSLSR